MEKRDSGIVIVPIGGMTTIVGPGGIVVRVIAATALLPSSIITSTTD